MNQASAGNSWQRLSYDPVAYQTDLEQSTKPLLYRLNPHYANHSGQVCRPGDIGYLGRVGTSIEKSHSLIDTDSEMKLLNYRATKSPHLKYKPNLSQHSCKTGYPGLGAGGIQFEVLDQDKCANASDKWHFPECKKLRTEYTQITHPRCDLRGTGVNRFEPLCLDPQHPSRWEHPSETGINYRMIAKDNHRPFIPKPMDQTVVFPHAKKNIPKKKVTITYCTADFKNYSHKFQRDSKYAHQ